MGCLGLNDISANYVARTVMVIRHRSLPTGWWSCWPGRQRVREMEILKSMGRPSSVQGTLHAWQ